MGVFSLVRGVRKAFIMKNRCILGSEKYIFLFLLIPMNLISYPFIKIELGVP
jgi:hypothetical protein